MEGARRRSRRSPEALAERRAARAGVTDVGEVLEFAARYLESRSRSVAEVRRRLTSAGFGSAVTEQAVDRLAELGYLDDEAFARSWVESRDRARPRGEHALRRELQLKGIGREVVDGALAERRGEGDVEGDGDGVILRGADPADRVDPDHAAAARLLEKKRAALLREPDPRRRRQRAYALLARNGFAPEVCAMASRAFTSTEEEPGEPD